MRIAISPRFATRTFENGTTVFSPAGDSSRSADDRPRAVGPRRRAVVRVELLGTRLLGDGPLHRSDDDRLARRADRAPTRLHLVSGLAARPRGGQAARPLGARRAHRP